LTANTQALIEKIKALPPERIAEAYAVPFHQPGRLKEAAVVVSNRLYNTTRPDVVVMAITSQLRSGPVPGEVWVGQWQAAGLLKPSAVKPVFATLEQALVFRRLGTLSTGDQSALREAIVETLG